VVVCVRAAAGEEEEPDEPDLALGKAKELNKEVELEETEIKKVAADEATPYSSAATFEELNLTPELLQVCVCVCVCNTTRRSALNRAFPSVSIHAALLQMQRR
jgi:hypothetical protein